MSKENICRLLDSTLIVASHDKGEPPSWVPAFRGEEVVWVDREIFEQLKELRDNKPCGICPKEIKKNCKIDKELKKFKDDIEKQEKRVYKKINPILELYDHGKIRRKELIEKLSEAFYELDKDD